MRAAGGRAPTPGSVSENPIRAARPPIEDDACNIQPFTGIIDRRVGSLNNVRFDADAAIPLVHPLLPPFDWKCRPGKLFLLDGAGSFLL